MTTDSASRAVFIKNIISFLTANHYDGVDIDLESLANSQQTDRLTVIRPKCGKSAGDCFRSG